MEEVLCAMALKSSNGRQTHHHHTKAGLPPVCREQALKSVGERGVPLRGPALRETARAREAALLGVA
jgi:hypothetical protein